MTVAPIEEWESKVLIQSGSSFLLRNHVNTSTISSLNKKKISFKHAVKVQTLKCAARFIICHRTLKFSANIHLNWKSLSLFGISEKVETSTVRHSRATNSVVSCRIRPKPIDYRR